MNNEQVAHRFIYNNDSAQGSNFRFNGNKLYSYSSLMATIERDKKIVLIDQRISCYSNTSKKHRNHLLSAIPSNYKVFEWYQNAGSFIETMHNNLIDLIKKQSRARKVDYSNQIVKTISDCNDYASIFNDELTEQDKALLDMVVNIDTINLVESSKHLIEANQTRLLALKAKEDEKRQESRQNNLNKFLGTTDVKFDPNYNSVYLKVISDTLYTSNSIQVPLKDSITLYKVYLSGKNILNAKLGSYTVVKSSKKSVTIGCTTISAIELNRVLSIYL